MEKYEIIINNPIIGVPITWLDKYCPEQFEILGCSYSYGDIGEPWHHKNDSFNVSINNKNVYKRIFIRWKSEVMPHIDEDGVIIYEKV